MLKSWDELKQQHSFHKNKIFLLVRQEAVAMRCSVKKVFLEISQNSQENTCAKVSLLKRRFWHRCFPVNFVKFLEHLFLRNAFGGCFCQLLHAIHKSWKNDLSDVKQNIHNLVFQQPHEIRKHNMNFVNRLSSKEIYFFLISQKEAEAVVQSCSVKRASTLLNTRLWHRQISKNTFFYRVPLVAASEEETSSSRPYYQKKFNDTNLH